MAQSFDVNSCVGRCSFLFVVRGVLLLGKLGAVDNGGRVLKMIGLGWLTNRTSLL